MKRCTVYYVEKAVWGAFRTRRIFFRSRKNAKKYLDNTEYTSYDVKTMRVTESDLERMEFEDEN